MSKRIRANVWESKSSTILSITLVLFVLGVLTLIEYHSYRITQQTQERITYKVDLLPDVDTATVSQLRAEMEALPYVKQVDYISKEEAADLFSGEIGEDFVGFIGYNPLYPSFMVNFRADMLPKNSASELDNFCKAMSRHECVAGVNYQEVVVSELYDIFNKLTWFLIIFIALLLVACVLMIRSTVRLAFYSMRDTLQTMRLVGATMGFIARPFGRRALLYGAIGGLLADLLLAIMVMALDKQMNLALTLPEYLPHYCIIAAAIIAIGMLITWISTMPAIRKQINQL